MGDMRLIGSAESAEIKQSTLSRSGATLDYPDQKFVLFKKLPDGRIRKVETFSEPISREQAISMYGHDHYMHQSMKPRTRTIWNDLSAYSKEGNEKNEVHVIELQRIERKTKYL